MLKDEGKLRDYIREYPDQVFVNQNNLFSITDYKVEEVGYAATIVLDDEIPDNSGSYTIHEECMSQCIGMTRTYYEDRIGITPSKNVKKLVNKLFSIAEDEEDEFTALAVFMPFIRSVEHDCMFLDTLHENMFEEPYFEVLLEGPKQNRFWISKYGN